MRPLSCLLLLLPVANTALNSQTLRTYSLSADAEQSPSSNSINELVTAGDTLWAGSSRGPSFAVGASGGWSNLAVVDPLKVEGVSGIAVDGDVVWVSYATSTRENDESLPTGDDLFVSLDRGVSWTLVPQPIDVGSVDTLVYGINRIRVLNITTKINNITYDIASSGGKTWTANFAGMLRMTPDSGKSWSRVILPPDSRDSIKPTDSLDFDLAPTSGRLGLLGNLNHRVFSVTVSSDGAVWVGTAGGINRSTDGGDSWKKFTHTNQAAAITGNFVVAMKEQRWGGRSRIWAATVNAEDPDETRGVSYTDDNGVSWSTALSGEFAHNFAFRDSVVYVATDGGLYRSIDLGLSWVRTGSITDEVSHQQFASSEIITTAVMGDTVWAGGPEGLAWTVERANEFFGETWTILRTKPKLGEDRSTYSYPLPFSPGDEVVRLHYPVPGAPGGTAGLISIRIFDFGMVPVRTLLHGAARNAGREYDEIWDGRNDYGDRVANGAYFYSVGIGDEDPLWGKILVVE